MNVEIYQDYNCLTYMYLVITENEPQAQVNYVNQQ